MSKTGPIINLEEILTKEEIAHLINVFQLKGTSSLIDILRTYVSDEYDDLVSK